jgi:hypothetical protein
MSQIETKVLKQGKTSTKVLSCSFFTMQDSYRKFEKYQKSLKEMLEYSKSLKDFERRIYTDDTGSEFALKVAKDLDNVTVIHYNCPEFREGSGHVGTFGTLVRFLPMFEKGLECVWITDIDIPVDWFEISLNKKIDAYLTTAVCYERTPYRRQYTLIAGHIVFWFIMPQKIFTHFINKVLAGDYNEMIETLNNRNNGKAAPKPHSKFPYGMDEVFINEQVYNYLIRHNKKCFVKTMYNAQSFISYLPQMTSKDKQYLLDYYFNPSEKTVANIVEVYKKYIPLVLNKYPCLQLLLDNIPKFKDRTELYKIVDGKDL